MGGKPRFVPIRVDDERVTEINLEYRDQDGYLGVSVVPVPLDDQLTRKIDGVTKLAASKVAEYEAVGLPVPEWLAERSRDAADIRAAFSLDQEDEP